VYPRRGLDNTLHRAQAKECSGIVSDYLEVGVPLYLESFQACVVTTVRLLLVNEIQLFYVRAAHEEIEAFHMVGKTQARLDGQPRVCISLVAGEVDEVGGNVTVEPVLQ